MCFKGGLSTQPHLNPLLQRHTAYSRSSTSMQTRVRKYRLAGTDRPAIKKQAPTHHLSVGVVQHRHRQHPSINYCIQFLAAVYASQASNFHRTKAFHKITPELNNEPSPSLSSRTPHVHSMLSLPGLGTNTYCGLYGVDIDFYAARGRYTHTHTWAASPTETKPAPWYSSLYSSLASKPREDVPGYNSRRRDTARECHPTGRRQNLRRPLLVII